MDVRDPLLIFYTVFVRSSYICMGNDTEFLNFWEKDAPLSRGPFCLRMAVLSDFRVSVPNKRQGPILGNAQK